MSCSCRPVRWAELNSEQQNQLGNGCGPDWFPDWLVRLLFGWFFEASCRRHDFAYERGGSREDRKKADRGFLKAMMRDAERLPWYKGGFAYIVAGVFYLLVRLFGSWSFYYGPYKRLDFFFMTSSD